MVSFVADLKISDQFMVEGVVPVCFAVVVDPVLPVAVVVETVVFVGVVAKLMWGSTYFHPIRHSLPPAVNSSAVSVVQVASVVPALLKVVFLAAVDFVVGVLADFVLVVDPVLVALVEKFVVWLLADSLAPTVLNSVHFEYI